MLFFRTSSWARFSLTCVFALLRLQRALLALSRDVIRFPVPHRELTLVVMEAFYANHPGLTVHKGKPMTLKVLRLLGSGFSSQVCEIV